MNNKDVSKELADIYLKIGAVTFHLDNPITFVSGIKSPIYVNNRILHFYPKERTKIVKALINHIDGIVNWKDIDCISSTATAAIPMGAVISHIKKLPHIWVKTTAKGHGKKDLIQGGQPKEMRVLPLEDHISTGQSLMKNVEEINKASGLVTHCIALTTYEMHKSHETFEKVNVVSSTLLTIDQIIHRAIENKHIDSKKADVVLSWLENPATW